MKLSRICSILVVASILTAGAFAAKDTHKGDFHTSSATQVNGAQLPAGDYVAQWEGAGPAVQVNIMRDGKVVATAPARLVTLDKKASGDATEVQNNSSGDSTISEIRFSGKPYSLQLAGEAGHGDAAGGKAAIK